MKFTLLITLSLSLLLLSVASSSAQSTDRDNPTRLRSNVISGDVGTDTSRENYHFSFVAGPGEITLTFSVRSGGSVNQVSYDLFDEDAKLISGKFVTASMGRTEQSVERLTIKRRQLVLLRVISSFNLGPGSYRIRLGGAVDVAQGTDGVSTVGGLGINPAGQGKDIHCLPKHGTLIVKMKDGSKKIIDLSDAETVTVVP